LFGKIIFVTALLAGLSFLVFKLNYHFHMLQLNSYMNGRYLLWLRRNPGKAFRPVDFLPFFVLLPFVLRLLAPETETAGILPVVLYAAFGAVSLGLIFFREKTKAKKKIKYTARVKRLFTAAALLCLLLFGVLWQLQAEPLLFLLLVGFLQPFVAGLVFVSNIILIPVEKGINYYYFRDAQKKVQAMPHLKVIGLTGSYGKTSTKHIVQKILSQKYNVLMTPGSYNTTMGVILTIRQNLSPLHDFFIMEMGAKKPGDITEICQLVQPDYGILTSIGPQHLETFQTIENVQKTKFELIRALPSAGFAVVNGDDACIAAGRERYGNKELRYISYGIAEDESAAVGAEEPCGTAKTAFAEKPAQKVQFRATKISYSENGTEFTVVRSGAGEEQEYSFRTGLLGQHNLYNILAGISLAFTLGMDYKAIYAGVKDLTPIEHRLQIKRQHDYVLIDDAYNANPVGTRMALEVLRLISGNKKILITPGMIELGSQEYELNKAFARQAAEVCDYILLVGEKRTQPLQDGLREANYPPEKYTVVKDIFTAFAHLEKIREKNDVVLIENDLTDDYDE
jgi:UDP-N-acetylmuramoyl-tripeptide--D-alanyl-D-alanine ligase